MLSLRSPECKQAFITAAGEKAVDNETGWALSTEKILIILIEYNYTLEERFVVRTDASYRAFFLR
jgi:hypothetical protein